MPLQSVCCTASLAQIVIAARSGERKAVEPRKEPVEQIAKCAFVATQNPLRDSKV